MEAKGRELRPFVFSMALLPFSHLRRLSFPAAALVLAALCYLPGLHGPFLFDDFANLPALDAFAQGHGFVSLISYLTSGQADPTGRPVALLTFLADAQSWPAEPFPFKRTNLLIHLANGVLLHALLLRLGTRAGACAATRWSAATFGSSCWLLHPLLVSTTLYVVQREAMLATMFVFVGLLAYDRGRRPDGRYRASAWAVYLACIVLATLSKANGVLLPVLAAVLEIWLPPVAGDQRRRDVQVFLFAPAACVAAALLVTGLRMASMGLIPYRGWSIAQRLLTEPRVLLDYLASLWIPRPFAPGIFNDNIVVSTSMSQPWTTLPALVGIAVLAGGCWLLRRRAPLATAALAFFFGAQLVESTVVPLELYFEHRNYLASALMFWPLGFTLGRASHGPLARWARLGLVGIPVCLAVLTWMRAELWGDGPQQALLWAKLSPTSARAQTHAATVELELGRTQAAIQRLRTVLRDHPDQPQIVLTLVDAECEAGRVDPSSRTAALAALRASHTLGHTEYMWVESYIRQLPRPCEGIDRAFVGQALDAMQQNAVAQDVAGRRQDVAQLRGSLALHDRRPDEATAWFSKALRQAPSPAVGLKQTALLADAGATCAAMAFLESNVAPLASARPAATPSMAGIHAWWLWKTGYWTGEIDYIRHQLRRDVTHANCPRPR